MRKAAFLDRDGIINQDLSYVSEICDFNFKKGIFNLLRILNLKGYVIFIVTNQSGIARGFYTETQYSKLTNYYINILKKVGIEIKDILHCPHHPNFSKPPLDKCYCRKPKPGLFLKIKENHNINMKNSIAIGDSMRDLEAAFNSGINKRFLITNKKIESKYETNIFCSLEECSEFISENL